MKEIANVFQPQFPFKGIVAAMAQMGFNQMGFNPRTLFANNEPGVWYDPSDLSTLFQDAAGTTPVTAVEQPVGLMLDKSKGLALGPELVTNGDFSNADGTPDNWVGFGISTRSVVSGVFRITTPTTNGNHGAKQLITGLVAGNTYKVSASIRILSAVSGQSGSVRWANGDVTTGYSTLFSVNHPNSSFVDVSGYITPTGTTVSLFLINGGTTTAASTFEYDNISVRELPGFHAYQTTATSRPVLSARYNLLTKTEQFDDAVWMKSSATVTANATTAPDGTTTADLLYPSTTGSDRRVISALINLDGSLHTASAYIKSAGKSWAYMLVPKAMAIGDVVWFDLANGVVGTTGSAATSASIQSVGNGWYRCSVTGLSSSASFCAINVADSNGSTTVTANGTSGIYIWGASLVPANQAHLPYQRVNTATDYDADPAKFPHYLRFDGVDDWMVTNTITPGIDKVQVFAGVRKLSDGVRVIADLGPGNTAGSLVTYVQTPTGYGFNSVGTFTAAAQATTGYGSPITNVLTGLGDISGDSAILRVNGTQAASSTTDQGPGNYLAYPLYIGRRAGTTLPFNGHLYGLIVRFGSNLPAATIERVERFINTKTRAY